LSRFGLERSTQAVIREWGELTEEEFDKKMVNLRKQAQYSQVCREVRAARWVVNITSSILSLEDIVEYILGRGMIIFGG
jgi:hypothetical protein